MISSTIYVLFLIPCLFAIGDDVRRRWPGRFPMRAVTILVVCLIAPGCQGEGAGREQPTQAPASGQSPEVTGDVSIAFASEPDPLKAGENSLVVTVADKNGTPIDDATVKVALSMPAMNSMNMPAMRTDATLSHEAAGRYRGTGQLSMAGTWNVVVTVFRGAEEIGARKLSVVAK